MDYEKMLDMAIEKLPKRVFETSRFEIPKVRGHIQGSKTVISNFPQIAETLGRPPEHLLKYVLKELATPGDLQKSLLIIGRKISASQINDRIIDYATEFVICQECKKPDTKLKKEGTVTVLQCEACGARHPVRTKI